MNSLFWKNFWRRKKKFVDRKQQTRYAIEVMLIVVTFPILFYVLVCVPPFSIIFFGKNAETMSALYINQLQIIKSAWIPLTFCFCYVGLLSVLFSHKIFGPIFRLSQALKAKVEGKKDIYCGLRKGDYFEDFADLVDKVVNPDKEPDKNKDKKDV